MRAHLTDEEKEARLEDWLEMSAAGATLQEMGDKYGITRERVRQCLLKVGVVHGEIKEARRLRLAALPITCHICGKQYQRGERHYVAGAHRNMIFRRSAKQIERDAGIAADYDQGMLLRDIVAKYKTSATMVTRALAWAGMKPNRHPTAARLPTIEASIARYEAIAADYDREELLNEQIAEKHGVTTSLVGIALRRLHVPALTRSEALRRRARILHKQGRRGNGKK